MLPIADCCCLLVPCCCVGLHNRGGDPLNWGAPQVSGGEMFEHLTRNGPYSEATAAGFMRELAAALRFLHSHEIIHADLKPENLMLSSWDLVDSKLKVRQKKEK